MQHSLDHLVTDQITAAEIVAAVDGTGIVGGELVAFNRGGESAAEAYVASRSRTVTGTVTDRQFDFILDLLQRRQRSGEEGGFIGGTYMLADGGFDLDKIKALSKTDASQVISSLKGDY